LWRAEKKQKATKAKKTDCKTYTHSRHLAARMRKKGARTYGATSDSRAQGRLSTTYCRLPLQRRLPEAN